ncbi:hypothetical protein SK128_001345 [Halocaridina rubra]|uniref:Uncharacterized protein n=1 Tax=Halocaridina rubra TaxID=373956 RepID=A0AAN8XUI2_HALRR
MDDMGDMASRIGTGLIRSLNGNIPNSARERPIGTRQNQALNNPARQTSENGAIAPNAPSSRPVNPNSANNLRQTRQRLTFRQFVDGVMSGLSNFVPRPLRRNFNRNKNNRIAQVSTDHPETGTIPLHHISRRDLLHQPNHSLTTESAFSTSYPSVQVRVKIYDGPSIDSSVSDSASGFSNRGIQLHYHEQDKYKFEKSNEFLVNTEATGRNTSTPGITKNFNIEDNDTSALNSSSRSGLSPSGFRRFQHNQYDPLLMSASEVHSVTANYGNIGFDFSDMDVLNSVYLSQKYQNFDTIESSNRRMGYKEGFLQGFNQGYDAGKVLNDHITRDMEIRNTHNNQIRHDQVNGISGVYVNKPHHQQNTPVYSSDEVVYDTEHYIPDTHPEVINYHHFSTRRPVHNGGNSGVYYQNTKVFPNNYNPPHFISNSPTVINSKPVNIGASISSHQNRPPVYPELSSSSSSYNSGHATLPANKNQISQTSGSVACTNPRCLWDYLMWYLDRLQPQ